MLLNHAAQAGGVVAAVARGGIDEDLFVDCKREMLDRIRRKGGRGRRRWDIRWMARNDSCLGAEERLDCSRYRTSIDGSGLPSTTPMLPSLSTMEVLRVEGGLLRPAVAVEKMDEVVAVEARLSKENFEAIVIAESRRSGMEPSDALIPENCLVIGVPFILESCEAPAEFGDAEDAHELDTPSIEFLRRFARHSCALPVYSRLGPLNNPDKYGTTFTLTLSINQCRTYFTGCILSYAWNTT